ncbi:class I SAM-dependent methyltransferase [Amycolatopsis orientalis]|uniref:class I SAM-dependent methyltransferase n=1 Tax=Amycolatopsis orientalis TaxID=31958 RepID=UPI000411F0F0|nr:class I SAM-dependent methyltransferase [Amycolatopsis orientalis]
MTATQRWAEHLAAWAIPDDILSGAPESPWVLPRQVFIRRADAQIARPAGATHAAAVAALATPGTVLDVGAAAGATSLPLLGRAPVRALTAVDADTELLAHFAARARTLGTTARVVEGRWPEQAGQAGAADVVVCGNVLYNVVDLGPFVRALTASARRTVIAEIAAAHPLTELNPLWRRFHGIERPAGPTAEDCVAALAELGVEPKVERWRREPEAEYATFAELVDVTRRRLCLPLKAESEVEAALLDLGVDPAVPPDLGSSGRELVTLSWPV